MYVYSLWDRKLKEFGALATARNDDAVKRALLDGIRGSRSVVEQHPDDFDVVRLGAFDPEAGTITPEVPKVIANVSVLLVGAEAVAMNLRGTEGSRE